MPPFPDVLQVCRYRPHPVCVGSAASISNIFELRSEKIHSAPFLRRWQDLKKPAPEDDLITINDAYLEKIQKVHNGGVGQVNIFLSRKRQISSMPNAICVWSPPNRFVVPYVAIYSMHLGKSKKSMDLGKSSGKYLRHSNFVNIVPIMIDQTDGGKNVCLPINFIICRVEQVFGFPILKRSVLQLGAFVWTVMVNRCLLQHHT